MQAPELFTPYLYAYNADGPAGYGLAAVAYATYQEPLSYTTSLDTTIVKCTSQSGQLLVPTTDNVQKDFYATFTVWRDKDHGSQEALATNKVDIPAYHRPYKLTVTELTDQYQSLTGFVKVQWEVKNPGEAELLEGDYFELQRATNRDFTDAVSLAMLPFSKDS